MAGGWQEVGMFGGRNGWVVVVVGTVRKTSNLSPCPVHPLVVKLECKMPGQCGDKHLIWREFGSARTNGFEGIRLGGVPSRPCMESQTQLQSSSWQPVVLLQLHDNSWPTQNEAVNIETMYTRQGGNHRNRSCVKEPMRGCFSRWFWSFTTEC